MSRTGSWYFVDASGASVGRHYSGPEADLPINTPEGCSAIEGTIADMPKRLTSDQERIEALEAQQKRPLRELALDPTNAAARSRLTEIDNAIAEARLNSRR